jgi:hypothetical protein
MELNNTSSLDGVFLEHVSLWYLLTELNEELGAPYHPGTLVEAIEKRGISGFDRVGRWKIFSSKDRQSIEAIEALEWFYQQTDIAEPFELENRMSSEHPLYRYGWPSDELMHLNVIREGMKALAPPNSMQKEINSSAHLIGCLAAMLLGKTGDGAHSAFNTKEKILDKLTRMADERNGAIKGVRETVAKKKINDALKMVGF